MGYSTLGLMLGYGCNARCRCCLWGEMINHSPRMSVEEACGWIDQAHGLGDLMLVGFSGGEPFLYLRDMEAVARYSSERYGLPSVAATNCFWASTPARARETLVSLHDRGLRQLLISVDDYHQEWVDLQRVKHCLDAAQDLDIICTLQCVVTASSHKLDYYLAALGVEEGERLMASEIPCTPVGYAASMLPSSEFPIVSGIPSDYCTMLQTLIVRPEGMVHLCCGPTFAVDPLVAGNLNHQDLSTIIKDAEWNPLFNALALANGPGHLAETLTSAGRGRFLHDGYASSCHACHHILGQPQAGPVLMELLEPERSELFVKRTILDQVAADRNADLVKI